MLHAIQPAKLSQRTDIGRGVGDVMPAPLQKNILIGSIDDNRFLP